MNERDEQLDVHDWQPLSVPELAAVMAGVDVPWWVAGGWAIDLFVGRQTRKHADLDVLVLRRDQLRVQQHLKELELYKTQQRTPSTLASWPAGEYLERETGICDIFARRHAGGPWRLQLMLMETDADRWVFRRDERIGGEISGLGWSTDDGVSVLRPEVQLLYKGKLEGRRAKDDADFDAVLPHLDQVKQRWLADGLRRQFGEVHPWLARLAGAAPADHVGRRRSNVP